MTRIGLLKYRPTPSSGITLQDACLYQRRRQPALAPFELILLLQVDEALAEWDDGMEFSQDAEEHQDEWLEERGGRAAKAARRGGTSAEPRPLHPLAFSDLLAAAPHLVDLLLQEDKARGCRRGAVQWWPAPTRRRCRVHRGAVAFPASLTPRVLAIAGALHHAGRARHLQPGDCRRRPHLCGALLERHGNPAQVGELGLCFKRPLHSLTAQMLSSKDEIAGINKCLNSLDSRRCL